MIVAPSESPPETPYVSVCRTEGSDSNTCTLGDHSAHSSLKDAASPAKEAQKLYHVTASVSDQCGELAEGAPIQPEPPNKILLSQGIFLCLMAASQRRDVHETVSTDKGSMRTHLGHLGQMPSNGKEELRMVHCQRHYCGMGPLNLTRLEISGLTGQFSCLNGDGSWKWTWQDF